MRLLRLTVLGLLAGCAAAPESVKIPLQSATVVFRVADHGPIVLKLDSRDEVALTLVGDYKEFSDGTKLRLTFDGDRPVLVIERDSTTAPSKRR